MALQVTPVAFIVVILHFTCKEIAPEFLGSD